METYIVKPINQVQAEYLECCEKIRTGLSEFDAATGGLRTKEISILGGRYGYDETDFCISICRNLMRENLHSILYFTVCRSSIQLYNLFKIQNDTQPISNINSPKLALCDTVGGTFNFSKFETTLRQHKLVNGLDLVIIDFIQLFYYDLGTDNNLFMNLKKLVEELNISLVLVSQHKQPNPIPIIEDLIGINGYDEFIENVYFLETPSPKTSLNLIIAKHKNYVNTTTISLKYNNDNNCFY
jgi:hypothetical protein